MSSILNATTTTGLVTSADNSGSLQLATNNGTTAVTIGTDQVVTLAQPLPAASGGTGLTAFPAPSTSGNILTSNGSAWTSAAPAGGGSWILISSIVASGSSTVDFTSGIDSTYKTYAVVGSGLSVSGTAEQPFYARVSTDGTFKTANYGQYLLKGETNTDSITPTRSTEDAVAIILATKLGAQTAGGSGFTMYFSNPSSTTQRKSFYGQCFVSSENNNVSQLGLFGGVHTNGTAAVDGLRFLAVGGTLSGTFSLYGIKTS
jgi:hypothetical protein